MSLKKHGIVVDCAQCQCVHNLGGGCFDVVVPISDDQSGNVGNATLHCVISERRHEVALTELADTDGHPVDPSASVKERLTTALDFVAEKRVCGNRKLCPSEVIKIAAEF